MASNIIKRGSLSLEDFIVLPGVNPTRADEYTVTFTYTPFNQPIQIYLTSSDNATFDPIVQIIDAQTNTIVAQGERSGDDNKALITNFVPVGKVVYKIRVTSFNTLNTDSDHPYTLKVHSVASDVTLNERLSSFGNSQRGQAVTLQGVLTATKDYTFPSPATSAPSLADEYKLAVTAFNQPIQISVTSSNTSVYDPFVQIINARTGAVVAADDDSGEGVNSLIADFLPQSGVDYRIQVTSFDSITYSQTYTLQVSTEVGEVTVTPRVPGIIPPPNTSPLTFTGDTAQIAYVAYYGRPADNAGLDFWDDLLTRANISYSPRQGDLLTGSGEFEAYNRIINAFGNSYESSHFFSGLSNTEKVNRVYNLVFNRQAEPEGLDFWASKLDQGEITLANLALEIALGAQDQDVIILRNKLTSATLFTNSLDNPREQGDYAGTQGALFGRNWLADFGATASTRAWADAAIAELVANDDLICC